MLDAPAGTPPPKRQSAAGSSARVAAPGSKPRGRDATSPWSMPLQGWRDVLVRTWQEAGNDNVGLVAAGVAFYGFLALVPLLGATVLSYGLVAEPETVIRNVKALTQVMPTDAAQLIGDQLMNVVQTSATKKGLGVLLALAIALFGARNGAGAIITALNIAYEETEKRGFVKVNLLAIAVTAGAVFAAILAIVAMAAISALEDLLPATWGVVATLSKIASYLLLLLGGAGATTILYRYAPSRNEPRWIWLTPGSLLVALLWLMLTLGFGIYLANFGNYSATYGSLSAVVVLLTWLYLSSYILLFGAELNSEFEHQTARDTTEGVPAPLGQRGAWVADHVAGEDTETAGQSALGASPEASNEAPADAPATDPHGASSLLPVRDYTAARFTARAAPLVHLDKVGPVTSGLATIALSLLRRPGGAVPGVLLLSSTAALAWLSRDRTIRPDRHAGGRPASPPGNAPAGRDPDAR